MKEVTQNEYHKSINRVIDYITNHLIESIDLETLSGVANISEFHFHRIFTAFIGESLASYISRLRLEKAAGKLRTTKLTLSEIAEMTGYQSQQSLSRAFKKHFGVTPSAFRNIQTYFSEQFPETGYKPMHLVPEIRNVSRTDLVYIRIIAKYGSPKDYDIAWKKLWQFARKKQVLNHRNMFVGLSFDDPNITKPDRCRFYACISTEKPIKPEGEFGMQTIESGKYAVFTLKGAYSGLNRMYQAIYFEWLPKSNVKLRNSMSFEKYLNNPDQPVEPELVTEIFIPIE